VICYTNLSKQLNDIYLNRRSDRAFSAGAKSYIWKGVKFGCDFFNVAGALSQMTRGALTLRISES